MAYFLVATKMFSVFSAADPLRVGYFTVVATVLLAALAALAATVYFEYKSNAAFCQIANLIEDLDAVQAKHPLVVNDLKKTVKQKLANIQIRPHFTMRDLEDTGNALERTRRIASAHFEFREALAKELALTRVQRDRAQGGIRYFTNMLEETRSKNSSQELVAFELLNQINFKANELRDMTLSLETIKKELGLANKFSQEVQDELDEQHVKIEEHEKVIEEKEKIILGLLVQLTSQKLGCEHMQSMIERHNLCSNAVITKLENLNEGLTREVEYCRSMDQYWQMNTANTVHAMQCEINDVRGELEELDAENKSLSRDLETMVERVESFNKERETMTQQIEQLERDVIASKVAEEEEKGSTSEEDSTKEEEEEEPKWYIPGPKDNWRLPAVDEYNEFDDWFTGDVTQFDNESKDDDMDEWIENFDTLVSNENEYEDNDLYDSLYTEDETLATNRIYDEDVNTCLTEYDAAVWGNGEEEEEDDLVVVPRLWDADDYEKQCVW